MILGKDPTQALGYSFAIKGFEKRIQKILNGMISLLKANSSSRVLTDNDCDVVLFYFSCIMERVEIHFEHILT